MDDLISRQAAIDALGEEPLVWYDGEDEIAERNQWRRDVAAIKALPSAQPVAQDINVSVKDCISRQAAIDAVDGVDWYHINKNGEMVHGANDNDHQAWYKAEDIYKAVESVPSAQQWISCSERLPYAEYGESDTVLTTCGYRDVEDTSVRWIRLLYFNGGNWCYPTGETYEAKVYAWCPIPEPWKGERDG